MIVVVKPGLLASVQDLGRHGQRELGICPGGALDPLALTLANRLVGNAPGAAGIELTMGRCELRFEADTRIALAGGDFGARLDGVPLAPHWSVAVRAGQSLVLGSGVAQAIRVWLAVAGGIDVPLVLGSRSTDLKAGFGGHRGRALRKGDRLALGLSMLDAAQRERRALGLRGPAGGIDERARHGSDDGAIAAAEVADRAHSLFGHGGTDDDEPDDEGATTVLRVMPGPEFDQFTRASQALLWDARWRVTPQSNRMGSRLDGPALQRGRAIDMLSSGVVPGTIQVPPAGQPIILMGDAQTTGGYPRIGAVIRADLWKLAQAPLGGMLRLVEADAARARQAWEAQRRYLALVLQGLSAADWPLAPESAATSAAVAVPPASSANSSSSLQGHPHAD
jgi:allophanate hydrolase subunit 2